MAPASTRVAGQRSFTPRRRLCGASAPLAAAPPVTNATLPGCAQAGPQPGPLAESRRPAEPPGQPAWL